MVQKQVQIKRFVPVAALTQASVVVYMPFGMCRRRRFELTLSEAARLRDDLIKALKQ
jgi:hypothetical protein